MEIVVLLVVKVIWVKDKAKEYTCCSLLNMTFSVIAG